MAQTYRPIEIIIVDDGSTDSTPGVAAAMQSMDPHEIRVLRIANGGPAVAREAGRQGARG
jgi:glycosyltransferase involved in cell wall biosynthesis